MTRGGGDTRCQRCGLSAAEGGCTCPAPVHRQGDGAVRGGGDCLAGRYRCMRLLGRGGFGEVHEAEDLVLGRRVAVKLVSARGSDAEFEREARALARLRHPNLVTVHDIVVDGPRRALVMELVDGPNLAEARRDSRWTLQDVVRVAERIAAAIEHAHERGVLHGDIKPANVLLDSDGRPRVTDFGTARFTDAATTSTGPGAFTLAYAAPELLEDQRLTAAGDVYSLGALLFDLVAGRPPFDGASWDSLRAQIQRGSAPRLRSLVPDAPPELEALVASCLARSPLDRPPGARAVRLALERLAAPPSPRAAEESVPVRLRTASAVPSSTGERRRVLVLELALRHLDDLREELAEQEWEDLRHDELRTVLGAIERHGGLVQHAAAASVTALFGLRGRRDNEAQRAATCALELVSSRDEIAAPSGPQRRRVAVALHAAHAVAPGPSPAWTLRDDVRRHGAALLEHVPEGEVLLTDDVMRAARDSFATEPAGLLPAARGGERDVPLHRLAPERAPDLRRLPLRGRSSELALALDMLRSALERRGMLLTIEGAAGAGKTRLLEEIVASLAGLQPAVAVARARALPDDGAPRRAFADLFASLERTGLVRFASASLGAGDLELLRCGGDAEGVSPEQRAQSLAFAWRGLLEAASHDGPVVLAVEDVHELSRESRDVLGRLAEATRGLRVAWIATHRQDFAPPWTGRPHHRPLVLGPLGEEAEAALVQEVLGAAPGPRLRGLLHRNADGLALHAIELARSLRDEGHLVETDDGVWELAHEDLPPSCPLTLQELFAARFSQLSPGALAILQCGAVLGPEFAPAVAARMAALDGHDVEIAPVLSELQEAELLHRSASRHPTARFHHDLVRAVAIDDLMPPRRRALSGLAARALAETSPGDLATDMARARHLAASDDPGSALDLALSCAHRLAEAGEGTAALSLARVALDLAERLRRPVADLARALTGVASASARLGEPDAAGLARRAVDAADAAEDLVLRARARFALGRALGRARDPREALQVLEDARRLAVEAGQHALAVACRVEQLGPAGTLGDSTLADEIIAELEGDAERPPEFVVVPLRQRARQLFAAGEHDAALRVVEQGLELCGSGDTSPGRAHFLAQRCPILAAQGRLLEARAAAQEALAVAARAGVRPTQSYLRAFLAYIAVPMGDLEAAAGHARAAAELSARLGSAWDLAVAQRTVAEVLGEQGHLADAMVQIDVALETARELDARALVAAALLDRGRLLTSLGDVTAAERELRDVLALLDATPHRERLLTARAALRRAARAAGLPMPADLREMLPEEATTPEGAWIALDAGDTGLATTRARAAVEEARAGGRRLDEARACLALAAATAGESEATDAALALARACSAPELACDVLVLRASLTGAPSSVAEARSALRERAALLAPSLAETYLARPDRRLVLGPS